MHKYLFLIFTLFIKMNLFAATRTTTAVAGVWDIGGVAGMSDIIIVNHDWSSYDHPIFNNFTGSLTINSGGYLKVAGTFSNWHSSTIEVKSGGTLRITGGTTFRAEDVTGWGINVVKNEGTILIDGDFDNQFCNKCQTCADIPSCAVDPACKWNIATGTVTVVGNYTSNGLCANSLPVELIHFSAKKINDEKNLIKWITASEIDNDYFEIQRSIDGKNFYPLTTVDGFGNSATKQEYTFIDNFHTKSETGTFYYRIKQVDHDGSYTYSVIAAVGYDANCQLIQEHFSPNFTVIVDETGEYTLNFYNTEGQLLHSESLFLEKGDIKKLKLAVSGSFVATLQGSKNHILKGIIIP